MPELVHYAVADSVATITLDSPHNRNALSRQLVTDDITNFDYPLAMDSSHLVAMRWMAPRSLVGKPKLFLSFGPMLGIADVADPMGGPREGFERALSLIEAGCKGLLEKLAPSVKKAI